MKTSFFSNKAKCIRIIVLFVLFLDTNIGFSKIWLPSILSDNMVLQQKSNATIWGWTTNTNEKITITGSWNNIKITTDAKYGFWSVQLPTPEAGGPYTITIDGHEKITLNDILIGEVWLCSGQSNMEFTAKWGLLNADEEIKNANYPDIRFFQITKHISEHPQNNTLGEWSKCSPVTMQNFSSVAYFFGRKLHKNLSVPVGLISSNWGGTPVEVWMPKELIESDKFLKQNAKKLKVNKWRPVESGDAYNSMIYPIKNFNIAGVIWYQGESNRINAFSYYKSFPLLIDSWRREFKKDFPFYFVQIAPFDYKSKNNLTAAIIRDAQLSTMKTVPNTGMVVTNDIGDLKDIHPTNKQEVGKRLALWALAKTYGVKDINYSGPIYRSMKINKDKIELSFDYAKNGLQKKGKELKEFFIAGEDRTFYPAKAVIKYDKVIVKSAKVKKPIAVRFAFSDTAQPNLFNKAGLPASPFRTDNWKIDLQENRFLVPRKVSSAPNYWCTWYWQNYLIRKGQKVTNPDAATVYTNKAAREQMNEENIFGKQGMAVVMLPKTRSDYYFVIDHGWQDKRIEKNPFFTLIMDTLDFPRYAHLEPKDRIKQMNKDIKALGWKGLGLWVRGNPPEEEIRKYVEWSKYAGVEYWKIDGGDTEYYYATKIKQKIYPKLNLEHITGTGPVNPQWDKSGLTFYPSVYSTTNAVSQKSKQKAEKSLEVIKNTDVFRTYDAAPLLVSTTTMQRIHDILIQTAGNSEYKAILNIQDDCNVAAALGLLVAVKRHPMKTPRMYKGKDFHLQISGNRHVDKRLNEMDRFVLWQRIAPPMPAGYGTYSASKEFLIDSIVFHENDTWYKSTHGKMVRQSAPAIMTRNIALPEVKCKGLAPYVLASKFPDGAVAIATEGRVQPDNSWIHPKADIILKEVELNKPIGIFGYYETLTLAFSDKLPDKVIVFGQDLLSKQSIDITSKVNIKNNKITLQGDLIEEIGTMSGDPGDISVPGMVIKIIPNHNKETK